MPRSRHNRLARKEEDHGVLFRSFTTGRREGVCGIAVEISAHFDQPSIARDPDGSSSLRLGDRELEDLVAAAAIEAGFDIHFDLEEDALTTLRQSKVKTPEVGQEPSSNTRSAQG